MDAYICSRCGYLLIFRNLDGNPHQPLHLPTGWPCWYMGERGEGGPADPLAFPVAQPTPEKDWREAIDAGLELYREYSRDGSMEPFLALMSRELAAGRVDVVRDLLEEILYRFASDPERRSLIRQVVVSDAWQAMAERARSWD